MPIHPIKEFRSEFHGSAFGKRPAFRDCSIPVLKAVSINNMLAGITSCPIGGQLITARINRSG